MFFQFFKTEPDFPEGWDIRHLWSAQCTIASLIMANGEEYGKISESSELFQKIRAELLSILSESDALEMIIQNSDVRKLVMKEILQYLETEIDFMKSCFEHYEPALIKPRSDVIVEKIRTDPVFSDYIKSS